LPADDSVFDGSLAKTGKSPEIDCATLCCAKTPCTFIPKRTTARTAMINEYLRVFRPGLINMAHILFEVKFYFGIFTEGDRIEGRP